MEWLWWALAMWAVWIVWRSRESVAKQLRQRAAAEPARHGKLRIKGGEPVRRKLLAEVQAVRAKRGLPPRNAAVPASASLGYGSGNQTAASRQPARASVAVGEMPPDAGAVAVLAGTGLPQPIQAAVLRCWREHRHGNWRVLLKAMAEPLGEAVWDWPWFEESLARFKALGEFPDLPAWSQFEIPEAEQMPRNAQDGLCWLDMAEARGVLKQQGIKPVGRKKSDVMNALFQIPFEAWREIALRNWQIYERERVTPPDGIALVQIKTELLAHAMNSAEYAAERYRQVCELVEERIFARIKLDSGDALVKRFQREPVSSAPHPGLPPFFPGDMTAFSVVRT